MESLLKSIDIFSTPVNLRNKDRNSNNTTLLGGLVSVLVYFCCFGAIVYFTNEFFSREKFTTITSIIKTDDFNYNQFNKIPFMVRVTGSTSRLFANPHSIWNIELRAYKSVYDSKGVLSPIEVSEVPMKKCDIDNNKMFDERYKYLFVNMTDISSFLCPEFPEDLDLYGRYGTPDALSYFQYFVRTCRKNKDGDICKPDDEIVFDLSNGYVDYRTVTVNINAASKDYALYSIDSGRYSATTTTSKKIWLRYRQVIFNIDEGLVFESKKSEKYYQVFDNPTEVDIRSNEGGAVPGAFVRLHLISYKDKEVIIKEYMKAQHLLANLGGIIKGIMTFADILILYLNINVLEMDMFNRVKYIKNKVLKETFKNKIDDSLTLVSLIENKFSKIQGKSAILHKLQNESDTNKADNVTAIKDINKVHVYKINQINEVKKIPISNGFYRETFDSQIILTKSFSEYIFPFFIRKSARKELVKNSIEISDNELYLERIISLISKHENIFSIQLSKEQNDLFNTLYSINNQSLLSERSLHDVESFNKIRSAHSIIKDSRDKSNLDNYLVTLLP